MDRRELIKHIALMTGYALSAPAAAAILQGCQVSDSSVVAKDWQPAFLTEAQANTVATIAETILPRTEDAPGAQDVGVHRFIDLILQDYVTELEQQQFRKGFEAFDTDCRQRLGKPFVQLSAEAQLDYLYQVNEAALTKWKAKKATGKEDPEFFSFFLELKSLTIAGYFTSKAVGVEVLAYDPIPGESRQCAPLEEVSGGRVWANSR